jgi:hypothetical protein
VGEIDTPVLGEMIPPKNSRISWRRQEIANGGSWPAFTVILDRREVGNDINGERVCSIQGGYTCKNWIVRFMKPDSSVFPRQSNATLR